MKVTDQLLKSGLERESEIWVERGYPPAISRTISLRSANELLLASREAAKPRRIFSQYNLSSSRLRVFASSRAISLKRPNRLLLASREAAKDLLAIQSFFFASSRLRVQSL